MIAKPPTGLQPSTRDMHPVLHAVCNEMADMHTWLASWSFGSGLGCSPCLSWRPFGRLPSLGGCHRGHERHGSRGLKYEARPPRLLCWEVREIAGGWITVLVTPIGNLQRAQADTISGLHGAELP